MAPAQHPRPTVTGRARLLDAGLAAALVVLGVAEVLAPFSSRQGTGSALVSCLGVALRGAALTQRRTHPLLAVLAVDASFPLVGLLGSSYILFYGQAVMVGVALYAVARWAPARQAAVGIGVTALLLLGADLAEPLLQGPSEIAFHWTVAALVVLAALSLRSLTQRAKESQRRAVAAEVAAAEQAMAAVIEERARIARELHDIVAHAVSTIVVQAGAAEQEVEDRPALAREALATIRATGSAALGEMRRLVTVLREDEAAGLLEPQPGLAALPPLLQAMRTSGLDVHLGVAGEERSLPAGVDLAAYRVLQEALTNVRRHSTARRACVRVDYGGSEVVLDVHDPGPVRAGPTESGGHGLVGIRERVALYGGSVTTGPDGKGGYRVHATLAAAP